VETFDLYEPIGLALKFCLDVFLNRFCFKMCKNLAFDLEAIFSMAR